MSDRMNPIPFDVLIDRIIGEYRNEQTIFGVGKFFKAGMRKPLRIFNEKVETPFGPAAGPHTQLAQNIVAAYLCGGRFFELKTVQKLDGEDLHVAKPCISAADEGYNCEWSTELTVPEAYGEYVKAWFLLKILAKELELGYPDGFVFNMSVGYDLDGIRTSKIDNYIEEMMNASDNDLFLSCKTAALEAVRAGKFHRVTEDDILRISGTISSSITISTLHGCPPQEIERIAMYLLNEKKLNTFVKLNPTLLGYRFVRETLDSLGFGYVSFDDHHFRKDLQYEDAVSMLRRLQRAATERNLSFGVKLTNTCPVDVKGNELPSEEMYMSGRSLAPLTLALACKLSASFGGELRISYSGGADYRNIRAIADAGIWPVTMATTLLKPGGYRRLIQIADLFGDFDLQPFVRVNTEKLTELAEDACSSSFGDKKSARPHSAAKLRKKLPLTDCFTAPCRDTCPIHQDIPAYVRLCGNGQYAEALRVITDKNPLPFITGTICSHPCMGRCARNYYDTSVQIRQEKLKAAEHAYREILSELKDGQSIAQLKNGRISDRPDNEPSEKNVAVVGGGPAGLSAAYLLAREGIRVTIFEKRQTCGGVVRYIIPSFRIGGDAIDKDIGLVRAAGATIITGKEITDIRSLFDGGFTDVLLAVGAWEPTRLRIDGIKAIDSMEFLGNCKKSEVDSESGMETAVKNEYGTNIVVIGGGNTAMDTARTALRLPGVRTVRLVYRRTEEYMPADRDELELALQEGVLFNELRSPASFKGGKLVCSVMELGATDSSGRRTPVATGKVEEFPCSSVIAATGEHIPSDLFGRLGIRLDDRNFPVLSEYKETSVPHLYIAGDASLGPATVVQSIADATAFASGITNVHNRNYESLNIDPDPAGIFLRKGMLDPVSCIVGKKEAERCLGCATVCETCVEVCPNRANVAVSVPDEDGKYTIQILHVDGMCNECGNCATFCPYDGKPYKDKFTLFGTAADMNTSTNSGFAPAEPSTGLSGSEFVVRTPGFVQRTVDIDNPPPELAATVLRLIRTVRNYYHYLYYKR